MALDLKVAFPVMTEAGFPHGFRCSICSRSITVGQPYTDKLFGVAEDGTPITMLTCVYCECD